MSISRKNWSALSTLTRQWTVEDEEEVEREKRRKERSSSTAADPDDSPNEEAKPQTSSVSRSADAVDSSGDSGGGLTQLNVDFVEMLRVRDERRRMRQVETLRRHKEGEGGITEDRLDEKAHVEQAEKRNEKHREDIQRVVETLMSPGPSVNSSAKKAENASNKDSKSVTPTKSSRKFVSSLSFSFDTSPSSSPASSRVVSPLSPRSPPSLHQEAGSPHNHAHSGSVSPTPNGYTARHENGTSISFEPATKPAFIRQSSRTISFRMMRKKEEDRMPLQRSASVRIASKTSESNKNPEQEDEQTSPFQRNSRQRISSRSIKEKMERLAQSSQKWEMSKSPVLKSVCLADEVSRKRELFEKEQERLEKSHVFSKQDLRHVNISSKKSLFEKGEAH